MTPDLEHLQKLLYRLIASPGAVAKGPGSAPGAAAVEFDGVIRGDVRISAFERLEIYANAYFYRLLDCLKEDFPATFAVLGSENFELLVADYLVEFPPTEPSIFYAGRFLAQFLGRHHFAQRWPFAADLARLERTTIEVFHGPDATPLDENVMRSLPPEGWPCFELSLHPAVRILALGWNVSEVLRAVNEERAWHEPRGEESSVLVFRQNSQVYFRALEPAERRALDPRAMPATFETICEVIANGTDEADPASEINRLLQRWLADGVLVGTSTSAPA